MEASRKCRIAPRGRVGVGPEILVHLRPACPDCRAGWPSAPLGIGPRDTHRPQVAFVGAELGYDAHRFRGVLLGEAEPSHALATCLHDKSAVPAEELGFTYSANERLVADAERAQCTVRTSELRFLRLQPLGHLVKRLRELPNLVAARLKSNAGGQIAFAQFLRGPHQRPNAPHEK